MTQHWPVIIFAAGVLAVTGAVAWVVKAIVDIGRAVRLPKEQP